MCGFWTSLIIFSFLVWILADLEICFNFVFIYTLSSNQICQKSLKHLLLLENRYISVLTTTLVIIFNGIVRKCLFLIKNGLFLSGDFSENLGKSCKVLVIREMRIQWSSQKVLKKCINMDKVDFLGQNCGISLGRCWNTTRADLRKFWEMG